MRIYGRVRNIVSNKMSRPVRRLFTTEVARSSSGKDGFSKSKGGYDEKLRGKASRRKEGES